MKTYYNQNRQGRKILGWLVMEGTNASNFAKKIGRSETLVRNYINGLNNSKFVQDALITMGCPKEFLGLREEENHGKKPRQNTEIFARAI